VRWFRIRSAKIDPALRETFEQHGVGTMQTLLAAPDRPFVHKGERIDANRVRDSLLPWLTEQYDRAERKETWNLTMEAAITLLVGIEVVHVLATW
jgi:hypothetical protein